MALLQMTFFCTILLVSCVSSLAPYSARQRSYRDSLAVPRRPAAAEYRMRPSRGMFSCKAEGESCRGFPRCCGDLVCYWENGFSARTPGVCVTCIGDGQTCQRDAQCCDELVCQKSSMYNVNGQCAAKLPVGAECHDNDQCETEYCDIAWHEDVQGHGGRCAHRP